MKKILVIDDDCDILDALELVLLSDGYECETMTKGNEVYTRVRTYHPDLILLDVLLSGSDGRKICKTLKTDNTTKQIPIIMISAHPEAKDTVKECGADSFIPKPFSVAGLLDEIAKFMKN